MLVKFLGLGQGLEKSILSSVFVNKFYWNTAICLCIVYVLSSCNRDYLAHKAYNI